MQPGQAGWAAPVTSSAPRSSLQGISHNSGNTAQEEHMLHLVRGRSHSLQLLQQFTHQDKRRIVCMPTDDTALREQLVEFLRGGSAHVDLASALKNFPARLHGTKPEGAPHTAWELLEHMRLALSDLLNFATNPEYVEQKWPDDYWPKSSSPESETAWRRSIKAIEEDLSAFERLVKDPKSNLYAEIPWAKDGQTLLHEVLLAIDHNSYHIGEFVFLRRLLGAWEN
jgi:hypothetical protein